MVLMYLRKSRSDNPYETVEEVLSRHETMLQEYAEKAYGYRIPESQIYREVVSGEKIHTRPEMQILLKRIESSDVKSVLVVDPQRLSRGDLMDCGRLIQAFKYSRTTIVTPMKIFDLWDKFDEKMFQDELLRGRDYLEYAKEVMARGRKLSASEGWYLGSVPPFGYDIDYVMDGKRRRKTLKPNQIEAPIVDKIFSWFVDLKMSLYGIAAKLNNMGIKPRKAEHFSTDAVRHILSNPIYIGKISVGRRPMVEKLVDGKVVVSRPRTDPQRIFDGKQPAITQEERFYAAQERLGNLPKTKMGKGVTNPLVGILKCSCGRAMIYHPGRGEARLMCANRRYCGSRSVPFEEIYNAIIDALKENVRDFQIKIDSGIDIALQRYNEEVSEIKGNLQELDVQQERLFSFLESGTYDEMTFRKRNSILMEKQEKLKKQYEEILANEPEAIDYKEKIGTLYQAIDAMKSEELTAKQKNDFLKNIIGSIVYTQLEILDNGTRWGKNQYRLDIFLKN